MDLGDKGQVATETPLSSQSPELLD